MNGLAGSSGRSTHGRWVATRLRSRPVLPGRCPSVTFEEAPLEAWTERCGHPSTDLTYRPSQCTPGAFPAVQPTRPGHERSPAIASSTCLTPIRPSPTLDTGPSSPSARGATRQRAGGLLGPILPWAPTMLPWSVGRAPMTFPVSFAPRVAVLGVPEAFVLKQLTGPKDCPAVASAAYVTPSRPSL